MPCAGGGTARRASDPDFRPGEPAEAGRYGSDSDPYAHEMREAVMARLEQATIIIKSAAVADYYVSNVPQAEMKKTAARWSLDLDPTPDILAEVGQKRATGC